VEERRRICERTQHLYAKGSVPGVLTDTRGIIYNKIPEELREKSRAALSHFSHFLALFRKWRMMKIDNTTFPLRSARSLGNVSER